MLVWYMHPHLRACLARMENYMQHVLRSFQSNNKFTLIKHEHTHTHMRLHELQQNYISRTSTGRGLDRQTGGRMETDGQTDMQTQIDQHTDTQTTWQPRHHTMLCEPTFTHAIQRAVRTIKIPLAKYEVHSTYDSCVTDMWHSYDTRVTTVWQPGPPSRHENPHVDTGTDAPTNRTSPLTWIRARPPPNSLRHRLNRLCECCANSAFSRWPLPIHANEVLWHYTRRLTVMMWFGAWPLPSGGWVGGRAYLRTGPGHSRPAQVLDGITLVT